jgi:RNA polymerase sigma-70 factor (ECF subfamily)
MASASDTVLVNRIKSGDEKSFQELVNKYQARVYSIILGMVQDRNDADDIAQEVFVRVYRFLHTFKGKSQFYTWLYRITMNMCINAKNGHRREKPSVSLSEPIDDRGTPLGSLLPSQDPLHRPLDNLKNTELGGQLQEAIDSLPSDLKKTFVLREIDDLSYREMSHVLGCPQGTVKSRLFRAREELKQKLSPYLDSLEEK